MDRQASSVPADATIRGVFVFKAASLAEARGIAALDPTVAEKRDTPDVHPWLGPKGIGTAYFQWKKEHPEAADVMAVHMLCMLKDAPVRTSDRRSDEVREAYFGSLRRAGSLAAAGASGDDPDLFAVCIFKTASAEEALRAIEQDPAVRSARRPRVPPVVDRRSAPPLVTPASLCHWPAATAKADSQASSHARPHRRRRALDPQNDSGRR